MPKTYLPGYAEYYEERWFSSSREGRQSETVLAGEAAPFGTDLLFQVPEEPGVTLAVEICEDLWAPVPPSSFHAVAGATVLLVGHDMGLMAQAVDRLGVMYAGDLVETGGIEELFEEPLHPYTRLLIASLPSFERKERAKGIPGLTPSLLNRPEWCPFHPRCPDAFDRCRAEEPKLRTVRPNRDVACHLYGDQPTDWEEAT